MKKLPLSRQDFRELINEDCIYIDKTEHIYRLINTGFEYFFSRPRRFGKSLLISTLREIFLGSQELFKGLWIYDKIEWKKHPVVEIAFNTMSYSIDGLETAIIEVLDKIALKNDIRLTKTAYPQRFLELIELLSIGNEKVVILIDEYDKPIIDYLDNIPQAEKNRDILKNFYSVLKANEKFIKFLFITGVSKFSKVSIFSDLNQLSDITLNKNYATLIGITQSELETYLSEYISELSKEYQDIYINIYETLKDEYLGYSWDGKNFVYNPYCIFNVLDNKSIADFWFQSGTPTFLVKLIKSSEYTSLDFLNRDVTVGLLDKYEIKNMILAPLLFQTGYLTIKKWDLRTNMLTLDFPNKEVENSFSIHLLSEFNGGKSDKTQAMLMDIKSALVENDIEYFIEQLKILFEGLSYYQAKRNEAYFHSIFYLVIRLLGFVIESEILTIRGRIDCAIKTETHIYIIEFKLYSAEDAMKQIKKKQYHLKYMDDHRSIVLLGIAFDIENKTINDHKIEIVK